MPRRVKRRGTPSPSKRPAAKSQPRRLTPAAPEAPVAPEAPLESAAQEEAVPRTSGLPRRAGSEPEPEAAADGSGAQAEEPQPAEPVAPAKPRRVGGLPRRQPETVGAPTSQAAAQPAPLAPPGPAAPPEGRQARQSVLPRRDGVQGRAQRRRAIEADLVPLEEGPGVPMDRTPYLGFDLRRVLMVSLVMLALVLAGFVFLR